MDMLTECKQPFMPSTKNRSAKARMECALDGIVQQSCPGPIRPRARVTVGTGSVFAWGTIIRNNLIYIVIFVLIIFNGCRSEVPEFNSDRAFGFLEQQCDFGPRNPGSTGYYQCRDFLIEELQASADTVIQQHFQLTDPISGEEYQLTNVIGRFNPTATKRLLLGAHWDTRPWADHDPDVTRRMEPILGANDGASGVAVLLELVRLMKLKPPPIGVEIVFFDGEDLGQSGDPRSYARGSLAFASELPIPKPDEAIIIDMIGDADLSIPVERYSMQQNPTLVRELWKLARELDLPAFENRVGVAVFDDHIPLWEEAGIPAVDLIDFYYPNRYVNFWHTHQDLPQNCSPASLGQVGTLLTYYIYKDSN